MKPFTAVFLISLLFTFFLMPVSSAAEPPATDLHQCADDTIGVSFLCSPDWEMETANDSIMIILSEEPLVTFTIAKSDSLVFSLEELTNPVLKEMGRYADDFRVVMVRLDAKDALQVMAVPDGEPGTALLDYYLVHKGLLYSFLFLVEPRENIRDFEVMISKIKESIRIL